MRFAARAAMQMPAMNSATKPQSARPRPRRWLIAAGFLCWTALAALAVAWLVANANHAGNTVIRLGAEEAKSWNARWSEVAALARLNFPWALAWSFLMPYVLWIGARFHFDASRWRVRLPVLLVTGAGFIWASQWLSARLVAGQAMVVMVKYTADSSVEKFRKPTDPPGDFRGRDVRTNHLVTNRITRV